MPLTNPDNQPYTLDRWNQERREWHRALLLWAMQAPSMRSFRAVARALGCSDGSVRGWAGTRDWKQRVAAHGEHADQHALDLYRSEYMADFGKLEIPHVAPNVVRPLGALDIDDPAAAAAELVRERTRKATGDTLAEVSQAAAQEAATLAADNKAIAARHLRLVDAGLGSIAKAIKDKDIKPTLRDIPMLLEAREKLHRTVYGGTDDEAHRVVESARVRHAKETGGDLLRAMFEDAEECTLILGALVSRRGADLEALSTEDQQMRDAAEQAT